MKKVLCLLLSLALAFISTGCGNQFKQFRPIQNTDDLEGRKVGAIIGWASDYYLSNERKDVIIYRYDTNADMLMALCYQKIDAAAVEKIEWELMKSRISGLKIFEEPLTVKGWFSYINPNRRELYDDFNQWLSEYKNTDSYKAWADRLNSFDGEHYEWPDDLEINNTGKKVTFAYSEEAFPTTFSGTDGNPQGYENELMAQFCKDRNYCAEFIATSETDMYMKIKTSYDFGYGAMSEIYKNEAVELGLLCSDCYVDMPLCLVVIDDPNNLKLGDVDK